MSRFLFQKHAPKPKIHSSCLPWALPMATNTRPLLESFADYLKLYIGISLLPQILVKPKSNSFLPPWALYIANNIRHLWGHSLIALISISVFLYYHKFSLNLIQIPIYHHRLRPWLQIFDPSGVIR